ncbi:hypothetical protein PC510_003814 [Escherichia coli]|uniref:hypothetical protein n=1 Tax=Escherichia coli TaxID=562 RepID=UPI0017A2B56C|nr:hypothetical protein [Escherichia coli]EKI3096540.1 hypothetical protein [Escherichia coli]MBB9841039.1 hypothetical protein [Escherichia coli]MBS9328465.1 hypothetical protein [Escherichia coli]
MTQLSALERMDLQDQLADKMEKRSQTSGLDLIDLLEQIETIRAKLNYGASQAPTVAEPAPTLPGSTDAEVPQIVIDYKAGVFNAMPVSSFIETLRQIDDFEPEFITLDEVKTGAIAWVSNNTDKLTVSP